jgi:hypothetical protein
LTGASIELNNGLKNVRLVWEETQAVWKDAVSRDFETTYLTRLEAQADFALQAIDHLAPVLARALRECSASEREF